MKDYATRNDRIMDTRSMGIRAPFTGTSRAEAIVAFIALILNSAGLYGLLVLILGGFGG